MQNQQIQQIEARKSSLNWNKRDVIFFVLPIICTVLVPLGGLPYLCGRLSFHMGLVVCMIYPVIGVFIIYCFFAGVARLSRDWRKHSRKKKLIIVSEIVIPLAFVALFIIPYFIPIGSDLWPPRKAFTYGLRDRIRSKADIEAIRDWLKTLSKEHYTDSDGYIPPNELPKSLKELNPPPRVYVSADKNGNPAVRITWGAAIFHWGVTIGMEDMEIPASDFRHWAESWLLVEPGVYVWDF